MTLKTQHTTQTKETSSKNSLMEARKSAIQEFNKPQPEEGFKWLNEHSRQFLASGYLTEGVSPEERIMEIGLPECWVVCP